MAGRPQLALIAGSPPRPAPDRRIDPSQRTRPGTRTGARIAGGLRDSGAGHADDWRR